MKYMIVEDMSVDGPYLIRPQDLMRHHLERASQRERRAFLAAHVEAHSRKVWYRMARRFQRRLMSPHDFWRLWRVERMTVKRSVP